MPVADRGQLFPGRKFISTVLEALDTKTEMSGEMTRRYLLSERYKRRRLVEDGE